MRTIEFIRVSPERTAELVAEGWQRGVEERFGDGSEHCRSLSFWREVHEEPREATER